MEWFNDTVECQKQGIDGKISRLLNSTSHPLVLIGAIFNIDLVYAHIERDGPPRDVDWVAFGAHLC